MAQAEQIRQEDLEPVSVVSGANINDQDVELYCQMHAGSAFFHRPGWTHLVEEVYGHRNQTLIAKTGDRITGVLPLNLVKSPLTGKALISNAFAVGSGILSSDEQSHQALAAAAIDLGRDENVDYIELRSTDATLEGWHTKASTYVGFEKPIAQTPDEILSSIPRKRRAELRKALKLEKEGRLTFTRDTSIDHFYRLYALSLRNLGTPVFPKRFAQAIVDRFRDKIDLLTVHYDGEPIASLLSFEHGNRIMPYYVGASAQARPSRGFDFIYWQQMLIARERGLDLFDFGRSKVNIGSYGFKKTWGIEPTPLAYQVKLIGTQTMPDINPNNPKFQLATRVWKRLPVPVATLGGGVLARHFA